eukprot:9474052-Pyramimonas_sp.AAC.1
MARGAERPETLLPGDRDVVSDLRRNMVGHSWWRDTLNQSSLPLFQASDAVMLSQNGPPMVWTSSP